MINLTSNQLASEYDHIFAACRSEDELAIVISGINFAPMTGAMVAYITASADNAVNRIRRDARSAAQAAEAELAASEPHTYHNSLAAAYAASYIVSADEKEFNRIASAARGTVRFERFDDYVIIAHCHTVVEASICGYLPLTTWHTAIYKNDALIIRSEFNSDLSYAELNRWISASIVNDIKSSGKMPYRSN